MVIFRALGCNLEGIICQPAIWAQGELSVTRKALVLRVASGELAKHRPILDFGGAIGIFLCMMSIFIHRHDMMMIYTVYIYMYFKHHFTFVMWNIVCWWCASLVGVFLGCFCVLYIYILILYIYSNLGLWEWTLRWLGSLTFPDTQTGDNACATGESPLLPAVLVSPNDITMSPAVQLG